MGVDGYGEAVLDGFVPASYGSVWLGSLGAVRMLWVRDGCKW